VLINTILKVEVLIIGMAYFGNERLDYQIGTYGLLVFPLGHNTSNGVDLQRNNHDTMREIRSMQSKTQMYKLSKQMKKPNIITVLVSSFVTMAVTLSFFFLLFYGVTK
jgi:hypothetical protein